MVGYCKGEFLNVEEIVIPGDAIAVNRGYGAFDFFGVINRKGFYIERHLDRFFHTMRLMRLEISQDQKQVKEFIEIIIQKNIQSDFHIKLFAYPIDDFSGGTIKSELFIIPVIIPENKEYDYNGGIKLITKEYQRFLPEAKSTNYLPLVYWQNEISEANAVDVLYYSEGFARESSRGNVFMVKDGKVVTPSMKILKGITRSVVIDTLLKDSIMVVERDITMHELFEADEVFLSSTTKKILPVTKIDQINIGAGRVGQVSSQLLQTFILLQSNW